MTHAAMLDVEVMSQESQSRPTVTPPADPDTGAPAYSFSCYLVI